MQKNYSNQKLTKNKKKHFDQKPKKAKKHNNKSPANSFSNICWFFNLNTFQHTQLSPPSAIIIEHANKKYQEKTSTRVLKPHREI